MTTLSNELRARKNALTAAKSAVAGRHPLDGDGEDVFWALYRAQDDLDDFVMALRPAHIPARRYRTGDSMNITRPYHDGFAVRLRELIAAGEKNLPRRPAEQWFVDESTMTYRACNAGLLHDLSPLWALQAVA